MSVMTRWSDEIAAAQDEAARRALLGRIGVWRATQLSDIVAQRQASSALARLHALLGNHASAEREARSLVSLCQTHPAAAREDLNKAQALLKSLGGGKAVVGPRPSNERRERNKKPKKGNRADGPQANRSERGERGDRSERGPSRIDTAMQLASKGQWDEANKALSGGKGPRTQLARTWIRLAWALSAPDDTARVAGARQVHEWLGETLQGRRPSAASTKDAKGDTKAAPEKKAAPELPPHPLDEVVGQRVPKRWRDRLALLESAVADNPGDVDRIASMALDHHVAISGERSPAPWLANLTSTALSEGGEQTRATIDALTQQGVFAVSLYGEAAFGELVTLRKALADAGWSVTSVRRGVLSRGEPVDRRVWTLRAEKDGATVLYARAPESQSPWEDDLGERIAKRLPELCERVAVFAPGAGNAALRDAASAIGVTVVDDASAVAETLNALEVAKAPPTPRQVLAELLATGVPDTVALNEALAGFGRAYQAFRVARPILAERDDTDVSAARLAFLKGIDAVAPEHVRIPEGTSWAVSLEASGTDTGLLASDSRFGGPGIETVVAVAKGLATASADVGRVQIGASRKERREDAVLSTLEAPYGGLWRLESGHVQVAVLTELSPEGRVAATRLLAGDAPRVVVIPVDGDLLSWWRSTGGADPIGWTGDEGADVAAAVAQLPAPATPE